VRVTIFTDRGDAGRQLAAALSTPADAVVLGVARGGVVVAAEVARVLQLPLDVAVVRKLGAPLREEFAMGAIADGVRVELPGSAHLTGVTPEQFAIVEAREQAELQRRMRLFASVAVQIRDRTAIVIDDGIATGASAMAACRAVRRRGPARVVLAVPVAPSDWLPDTEVVDEYICPNRMPHFWAVGQFYADFTQTSDEEVARLLSLDLSAGS
jgi:putative phosphoribosyl transferase